MTKHILSASTIIILMMCVLLYNCNSIEKFLILSILIILLIKVHINISKLKRLTN